MGLWSNTVVRNTARCVTGSAGPHDSGSHPEHVGGASLPPRIVLRAGAIFFCYSAHKDMKTILQTANPEQDVVLRETSKPVPDELFGTPELSSMLHDMEVALDKELNGVALAAPQIGLLYRIFIVRFDRMNPPPPEGEPEPAPEVGVFINPSIVRTSKRRVEVDEGCLSVQTHFGKTMRYNRATVRAQDAQGVWFERGGGGILAQAYQHEIDHLNGMLFIDHATDLVSVAEHRARRNAEHDD